MKKFLMVLVLGLSASQSFATTINQAPGSSIRVRAGDDVTVTCEGSASGPTKECVVTPRNQIDKNGNECRYPYCTSVYKYGARLDSNSFSYASDAARWCDTQLAN